MCGVCGCGEGEARIEGKPAHAHAHSDHRPAHDGHAHDHEHAHDHAHDHGAASAIGAGPGETSGTGRWVEIERDILSKNRDFAEQNRRRLTQGGVLAINVMSSPGAGKTTLLTASIEALKGGQPIAVIEGDQETSRDADRIRATGAPAVQVNTGRGCHLDAHMVGHALDRLPLEPGSVLFIENVGNLVCPAAFDLGEARKVALLSVTEGDDKPIKYPDMFMAADLMILTKIDLLPHVDFDVGRVIDHARAVNDRIEVLELSARTGAGMERWLEWIRRAVRPLLEERAAAAERELSALKARLDAAE